MVSRLTSLEKSIRLARAILNEGARTQNLSGPCLWVLALLAKTASSASTVCTLLREGCMMDAKLVNRSIWDSMIDLFYILDNPPHEQDRLIELYRLEIAVDVYEEARCYAMCHRMTIEQLAKAVPAVCVLVEQYEEAKKHKAFQKPPGNVAKKDWPRRWKDIPQSEKLPKEFAKATKVLEYPIRTLGNAMAHARPGALIEFIRHKQNKPVGFILQPKPDCTWYAAEWLAFEACFVLLIACDHVVKEFHLSNRLSKRLAKIMGEMHRTKGMGSILRPDGTKKSKGCS